MLAFGVGVGLVGAFAGPASGERAGSGVRAFQAGLLDAGWPHSCAVLHDGSASCWGSDSFGQLGDDAVIASKSTPVAVALPAGRRAVAISAGRDHSCAVLDDGSASCWGSDSFGQLGDDAVIASKSTPVAVALPAGRRAVAISAGRDHSCAVLDDGSASCWGSDLQGRLGDDPAIADKATPVAVALPAGRRAVAISAGEQHSCVLLDDGSASCWGNDSGGRLGDDAVAANKSTPVAVALPAGRRAVAISAGSFHSCAVLDDGSASCWGEDGDGKLGDDAVIANKFTPVAVALPAGRRAVAISAGVDHSCAVLDDGSASCWGFDSGGQLGDDAVIANKATPAPVALPAGRRAVAISAGSNHSCVLLDDGSASCWGFDGGGQLGNGLDATSQPVAKEAPAALPPASSFGRVADLSLTLEGAPGVLAVGAGAPITARLRNDGPDAANATRVLLGGRLLDLAPALIGQGTLLGSSWQAGTLAVGAQTTLALNATAVAAGSASLTVEVAGQSERDPDSTPANDLAGEDDQASAQITVPTPGPPATVRARVDRLTLKLATRRAKRAPYRVKLSGRLIATDVSARAGCLGSITVSAKTATKTLATTTAKLTLRDGACQYSATLTITRKQRGKATSVKLSARFPGNTALLAASSTAARLRLG